MKRYLVLAGATLLSLACSRPHFVIVQTIPIGANVFVDGQPQGPSPRQYSLEEIPRFHLGKHTVCAQKDGYQDNFKTIGASWWQDHDNLTVDPATGKKGGFIQLILPPDRTLSPGVRTTGADSSSAE